VLGPSPGAAELALEEQRPGPDARRPQPLAAVLLRDEQRALLGSQEEEVRIAARQQPRRRARRLRGAQLRLVVGEQPLAPARRRPRSSSGSLETEKSAKSRFGTTYTW